MSYIAGDPGPRPQLGRGPWRAVGALLALLVVLAAALLERGARRRRPHARRHAATR